MTKGQAGAGLWLKDAAPGAELRKWIGHDRSKWAVFKGRYFLELDTKPEVISRLLEAASKERLTLLFSARDEEYNQAVELKEHLSSRSLGKVRLGARARQPRGRSVAAGPARRRRTFFNDRSQGLFQLFYIVRFGDCGLESVVRVS